MKNLNKLKGQSEVKIPKGAMRFLQSDAVKFAAGEEGQSDIFEMVAYSGKPIENHWYWNKLVIDLDGMKFNGKKFPILEDHMTDARIGFTTKKPIIEDNQLKLNQDIVKFLDTEESERFQSQSKQGFPFQASIYARPSNILRLGEKESAEVNGFTLKGPATIWRECEFKEASVVVFGADNKTSSQAFSESETENIDVFFDTCSQDLSTEDEEVLMDLDKLKAEHPDLWTEIESKFTGEIDAVQAKLQSAETKLSSAAEVNVALEDRVVSLEESDTIRKFADEKRKGVTVWATKLSASDIPGSLQDEIMKSVVPDKFMVDSKLDIEKFSNAVDDKIKFWSDSLESHVSVRGAGVISKTETDNQSDNDKFAKEDDAIVNSMFASLGIKLEEG